MRAAFLVFLLAAPAAASAEAYKIDASHSSVGFRIRHLVGRVSGRFNAFEGSFEFDEGKPGSWKAAAVIDAASIDTGNAKRDAHLRDEDFFDAARCPKIEFKSGKVAEAKGATAKLHGELTLRCVTKPVVLDVELIGAETDPWGKRRAGASARGRISRKDFGMSWNKTLDKGGMMLGDEVELLIDVEGVAASPQTKP